MAKFLRSLALVAAAIHLAAFLLVAVGRLTYPFELEWIEGGLVDEVRALVSGAALYGPPSARQVAFIYPPLYFYASAAAARVVGGGFLPLRLVSFAASGVCLALVVALARRGGAGRAGGLLTAGLFAATFKVGAGWLTLARVDALYLALFLAGAYVLQGALAAERGGGDRMGHGGETPPLRHAVTPAEASLSMSGLLPLPFKGRGAGGVRSPALAYTLSGLLFALACLTKQSALTLALPLAAYAVYADWRRGWLVGASLAAAALGASAWFNWVTGGWYGFYVFTGALAQRLVGGASLFAGWMDWTRLAGLAVLAVLAALGLLSRARPQVGLWLALAAGTVGTVAWVQLHQGAIENNRLPVLALLAVLAGLGFERARLEGTPLLSGLRQAAQGRGRRSGGWGRGGQGLVYGLCLLAFGLLAYNPWNQLPTPANRAAAQALAQRVGQVSGMVWLPQHGGLAWLAGKPSFAHLAAMDDVLAAGGPPADQMVADVRAALRERRFAAIVVDGPDFARRFPELEQAYTTAGVAANGAAFYNVAGARTLPEILYLPNR